MRLISKNKLAHGSFLSCLLLLAVTANSQENGLNANITTADGREILRHTWAASWVKHPAASPLEYGVFLFRRKFELTSIPAQFIIYISADNRYKLYVNGQYITNGPSRGDLLNWNYETIDIAPYLKPGENLIAAEVVNFGTNRPLAQHTFQTAFLLQSKDSLYTSLNTGNTGWKVMQNTAWSPLEVSFDLVKGFYAAGPTDQVDAARYPWQWNTTGFDDSNWAAPVVFNQAVGRGFIYGNAVHLTPRAIPLLESRKERFKKIARTDYTGSSLQGILSGNRAIVQKNTKLRILLDNEALTIGYPQLVISGGKGSTIKVTYAESLRYKDGKKGNRNEVEGKEIAGYFDRYLPDGGKNRSFEPLWWRTFRYVQLEIETGNEDLVIDDYTYLFTAYPFEEKASFKTDDPGLQPVWDVAWRTARLCATETYFDCPYYEQLQYVGDTRIQALVSLAVTGDDRLMKNALRLFNQSRVSDGITLSRYPSYLPQLIPTYSLMWINMLHDHYMYKNDPAFLKEFSDGITGVLNWFGKRIDSTGMLGGLEWWNFSDYTPRFGIGMPDGVDDGHSALTSLQYVYALQNAAELLAATGQSWQATQCRQSADRIKKAVIKYCYDTGSGLIAETPAKKRFSAHTTFFAILTNTIDPFKQASALQKVMNDTTVIPPSVYFRFYLARCLQKTGLSDLYLENLQPWKNMLAQGLTTFAEWETDPRSDCHAWSASPLFDLLSVVAGIRPASAGFEKVLINPAFGQLSRIDATYPHPRGTITVHFEKDKQGKISGSIELPAGLTGTFRYKNIELPLRGGKKQEIKK